MGCAQEQAQALTDLCVQIHWNSKSLHGNATLSSLSNCRLQYCRRERRESSWLIPRTASLPSLMVLTINVCSPMQLPDSRGTYGARTRRWCHRWSCCPHRAGPADEGGGWGALSDSPAAAKGVKRQTRSRIALMYDGGSITLTVKVVARLKSEARQQRSDTAATPMHRHKRLHAEAPVLPSHCVSFVR